MLKLTIKNPERRHWRRLVFLLLTTFLKPFSVVSTVDFEQVNASWDWPKMFEYKLFTAEKLTLQKIGRLGSKRNLLKISI